VNYTADGDTIALLHVDGKDYADYGDGYVEVTADSGTREDTDPLAIRALYASFAGMADDLVVAGRETTHGIATVHLVLGEDVLADRRESLGEGAEGWIAELWLAEADGQLVKAVWGRPARAATGGVWHALLRDRRDRHELRVPGEPARLRPRGPRPTLAPRAPGRASVRWAAWPEQCRPR